MASTLAAVGATTGRPSPQPLAANHSASASGDSSARSNAAVSPSVVGGAVMNSRYVYRPCPRWLPAALDPHPVTQQTAVVERGDVLDGRLRDEERRGATEREVQHVLDQRLLGVFQVLGANRAVDG